MVQLPEISFLIPAAGASSFLGTTIPAVHEFLDRLFPGAFEIIVIVNGQESAEYHRTLAVAAEASQRHPNMIRMISLPGKVGKGAALRKGVFAARGDFLFFTDADLPYNLDFFSDAYHLLRAGNALVSGNRRLPKSRFNLPVSVFHLAYKRHRLGIWFNRMARALFPIETTDTQAGAKALTMELAQAAFRSQICPGFLFDIEIFLTAYSHRLKIAELPVTLSLRDEKSTVRIIREFFSCARWLFRIRRHFRADGYRATDLSTQKPLSWNNAYQ